MLQQFRESTLGKVAAILILGFIGITFIFFGNFDFSFTGTTFAAKVNGEEIPIAEFERELQQYQNQYQQALRVELNDDLRREMRRLIIDRMIVTEALKQQVEDVGYRVSDERVAEIVRSTEAFQVGGEFSMDAYAARLGTAGFSPTQYEAFVRSDLVLEEIESGIRASTFLTPAEYRRYIELYNERREIGYATFAIEDFLDEVEISDEAVAAYYEENPDDFRTAETVDIEYIELSLESIADDIEVTDEDLREYYNEQQERFAQAEERRVRHILIEVEGDDYAAAEAEAQAALERLEGGEEFAAVAEEVSDDLGTRAQGGDLGWIGRGLLAGPFEETLFEMEVGETAGPVETEFGYHILRLEEIRAGDVQPFEAVREELADEVATERAAQGFYDLSAELDLKAFEAANSLAGVAEEMGLPLRTLEGFSRAGNPDVFPDGQPLVTAVFDEDAIFSGENTDLIELGEEHVVVARVTEHHPPEPEPLEAVREEIRNLLSEEEAQRLVSEAAAAFMAELEALEAGGDAAAAAGDAADAAGGDAGADVGADAGQAAAGNAGEEDEQDGADAGQAAGNDAAEDEQGGADAAVADATGADDADDSGADAGEAREGEAADDGAAESDTVAEAEDESGSASDMAAIAERHGGTWTAPRFVERTNAQIPREILSAAFNQRKPAEGEAIRRLVPLSTGGEAVLVISGVEPGEPSAVSQAQRDQRQRELADQAGEVEMNAYAGNVRDKASVSIPDAILNPQF